MMTVTAVSAACALGVPPHRSVETANTAVQIALVAETIIARAFKTLFEVVTETLDERYSRKSIFNTYVSASQSLGMVQCCGV